MSDSTNSNHIELRSLYSLSGLRFVVPDYQRGYRWTADEAKQMLDDFLEFTNNRLDRKIKQGEFYCLQPIVVLKRKDGAYELIDGQQRLTTLYIILKYNEEKRKLLFEQFQLYTIDYETRNGSKSFLENLNKKTDEDAKYIDYYYMKCVHEAVVKWFKTNSEVAIDMLQTMLSSRLDAQEDFSTDQANNVRVIWYEIDENSSQSPVDIFTRLNIGKIPLSNSELIRALLLRKDNFPTQQAGLQQIQIAAQWNQIEKALQNDNFWYFINGKGNPSHYDNRIELIFDLMKCKNKDSDFYHTFNAFSDDFRSLNAEKQEAAVAIWKKVMAYFQTLNEWFCNRELYHFVGFLIDNATNGNNELRELMGISKESDKNEFLNKIKGRIKFVMKDCQLSEISYGPGNAQAKKVLLLFNILTLLKVDKSDSRFPFGKFKTGKWDIEHVCSQTDRTLYSEKQRRAWLKDMIDYFAKMRNDKYYERLTAISNSSKIDEKDFNDLFNEISGEFKEQQIQDKDSLGNLALLDAETNRSYGNAFFPIKRQCIINNDEKGVFVPIATKNLFLKYYSTKSKDIMIWTQDDADDYFNAIETTLKEYLPKQANEHNGED